MKKYLIVSAAALTLSGCARLNQTLDYTVTDPKTGIITEHHTHDVATTFWDSKNVLDRMKTSNGISKSGAVSQTVGVNGLSEESSSTNTTTALIEGLKIIGASAIKP